MTKQEETDLSCKRAINHLLVKIRDDKEIQNLLGAGTETFALVTHAAALLFNQPVDQVRDNFIPGSSELYQTNKL